MSKTVLSLAMAGCALLALSPSGAQALAMADIGLPRWVEKDFDYDNSPGVSIAKLIGMHKPVWQSSTTGTKEDFGLFVVDTAI